MDSESLKQQCLLDDVKDLEKETNAMRNKLHNIENDIKKEMEKKHYYDVKIARFKNNIEFYTAYSEKLGVRLTSTNKVHSQFEIASECYEKILSELTENYIEHNYLDIRAKFESAMLKPNDNFQKEIQNTQEKIYENFKLIDKLLSDFKI